MQEVWRDVPQGNAAPSNCTRTKNKMKLKIEAFGKLPTSYVGMCGARTGCIVPILAFSSVHTWETKRVAEFIERFMRACRAVWPEWLPNQEPEFHVYKI